MYYLSVASQLAFAVNEEKVIWYQLNSENNLPTFRLNADDDWSIQSKHRQVIFQAKLVTDDLSLLTYLVIPSVS